MIAYNSNLVKSLGGEKVLILGFGREGRDTFLFLRKLFPQKTIGIADKNILKFKRLKSDFNQLHLGRNYLNALKKYNIIIKSPGIPPKVIAPYITKRQKLTSATEIFLENCPGTVICVTGTKGKSTTAAMIYHILKKNSGRKVYLVGNIGKPALSLLAKAKPNDIFVYETSSHQLYGLKKSPHIAIFLNIFPEHLDYYRNFQEYAAAKANICLWQNREDYLVYNASDKLVVKFVKKSKAKKIPIRGEYYELDRAAALAVAKIFKISKQSAIAALKNFNYLPHRLEKVGVFRGITFYNDSLSTIPQSTIGALDKLGASVETLIAGGYDRGVAFLELAKRIQKSGIKTIILFPPSGLRLAKELKKQQQKSRDSGDKSRYFPEIFFAENMKDATRIAFEHTQKNKICLLSPASPSFGLFKDYKDRGEQFKYYVKRYATLISGS